MKLLNLESGVGAINTAHATENEREKSDAEPFFSQEKTPFPLEALGEKLNAMGRAICAATRTPEALVGSCLLGIVSASIGAGLNVQSAPNRLTRANLFLLVSAASGSGKSETFRHAAHPFKEFEAEFLKGWETHEMPDLLAEKELWEIERERIKKSAKGEKGGGRDNLKRQLAEANKKLQSIEAKLRLPALHVEDITTERLAVMIASNGEQLASLSSDAGAIVNNLLGKHSKDDRTDESLYLVAFSGDSHRVDRQTREPVLLQSPCLSALWFTQPDKVESLLGKRSLTDGGLIPRLLICHTECEAQEIGEETPPIPTGVQEAYRGLIRTLLEVYRLATCPATVQPVPEALELMWEYFNSIVRRQKPGGEFRDIQSFASRWAEQAWRISVCLHVVKYGSEAAGKPLELETAQRAITLSRWFAE